MKNQDYHSSITTHATPEEAFNKITRVSEWWAKDFEGQATKPGDVFTVRFQNGDMYKVKVAEIIPDKHIVWDVIDSYQGWHDDHTEWVGTKIVWEVVPRADSTEVTITHSGLVPAFECFNQCSQGWDYLMKKSLQNLLNSNQGMPV
ncbi:SRPBCC family protein [Dictyobacter aurantiacus]|uniref:Activator of Hsp90 ATPase homologue 1/2-like C-terminal domain-containing protein n=1 Tax=Dictyobacter aurantiacus TaxID=1936993 RepID=A0A401ZK28_9CHLR|nr:SRPBCC domain-containing protein [Dictyobacter aurantiacus]GCE07206.1 hypothetical protein KDAU_45350 [Dictyobacter aurantiacus]